ncbi:hypothetical protein Tco_0198783 [Tanacetum coccineum]
MAQLKYCDKHNQVGFLRKPDESAGFAEIVDFLRGSNLRYALTTNPTIYDSLVKQFWQTATTKTIADGTLELHATIDTTGYTITEASIRDKLHLADASGITMLPNNEIFDGMGQMGYPTDGTFTFWKSFFTPQWRFLVHHILHCISSKSGGWDQFGSNIATALICLSTGRVYNFSKLIFDGMVANLKSKTKFLMYPRFLQLILDIQTENKHHYLAVTLTQKIFGKMKRGFRGAPRPLLPAILLVAATNPSAGQELLDVAQSQPSSSTILMTMDDLLQLVPQLMTKIDSLEKDLKQTNLTMGSAIVKLVKKVKKLEGSYANTKYSYFYRSSEQGERVCTNLLGRSELIKEELEKVPLVIFKDMFGGTLSTDPFGARKGLTCLSNGTEVEIVLVDHWTSTFLLVAKRTDYSRVEWLTGMVKRFEEYAAEIKELPESEN